MTVDRVNPRRTARPNTFDLVVDSGDVIELDVFRTSSPPVAIELIADRDDRCAHGVIIELSPQDLDDLIAHLTEARAYLAL